ncbi:MAG: redoxin domain-containing protein [Reyranella sp.]|nr:MAG: redoxin domain-containing protein [Reyranella sp.]
MTKILTPTDALDVKARDGLWMTAADAERVTGWTLKAEGMCRAELCVPMPALAVRGNEVDVAAFWTKLGGPVVSTEAHDVWALGAPADERNAALAGLQAPDFTLPDIDGTPRSLSQLRGRKVFVATWASW